MKAESGWREKERERRGGHSFSRGNIESKINHPGSKRWRTAVVTSKQPWKKNGH